jgi:2-C-methyl-D-erythritol 4-phosphate cytidylyltransferase
MEKVSAQPECAKEALDLLNCLADPSYDRHKCVMLLDAVRACVLQKVFPLTLHIVRRFCCFSGVLSLTKKIKLEKKKQSNLHL